MYANINVLISQFYLVSYTSNSYMYRKHCTEDRGCIHSLSECVWSCGYSKLGSGCQQHSSNVVATVVQ
jgi:hypothetical protein